MHFIHRAAALLALAAVAAAAHAATATTPVEDCVDLHGSHTVHRSGERFLLVADRAAHYRVDLAGSCGTLPLASRFSISTRGQAGRLCPSGTRVKTDLDSCRVAEVVRIDAQTFADLRARRGR